jgi:WD40 repeat protein/DNA-binding SARP family transcriptional activator
MRSDKVRALLSYLAVEWERPHRREKLAGLLWPDYPESSARSSLRRALADLRKGIGDEGAEPPYLLITRQMIQFNQESEAWVDVTAFTSLSQAKVHTDQGVIQGWREAVDMYRGEFMEGFSLPDSPAFEEWQLLNREHHHRQVLETLHRLSDSLEAQGEIESALPYAWRQVEIEPSKENAHRQIMRLLALNGQRDAALAQYETLKHVLARELGVEPAQETQELNEQLLKGEWPTQITSETLIAARQPRSIGESPYRGLSAFREEDAPFFFGREQFTSQLLAAIKKRPVIAVILGPSGSGKSSVAYAGLLPRLRERGDWLIAYFRPGARPFHALAAALLPLLESALSETDRLIEAQKLAKALMERNLTLNQLLERVLENNLEGKKLLLLIDQFEELYTFCPEPEMRQIFIDGLLSAFDSGKESHKSPFALLITMRADFMGQALAYRPYADALQNASLMLGPMTHEELRAAIEKPAEKQGAAFEEGLVERILDVVGEEPGNLPLLEFALTLLWDKAASGWLTHDGYELIGQVDGALARYADQVYEELDDGEREATRQVFVQLVRPGKGTEDTRRVADRSEIGEGNWPLTQYLADKRLVVTGRNIEGNETIEVVHETLIRNWDRLQEWIEEDRAFRIWQESLRDSIQQWETTNRDEGAHLRGVPLVEAESWGAERGRDLSPSDLEFIQISLDSRNRMQEERSRLRQRITIGLAVGLVITLILAVFAGLQWRQADLQRNSAIQAQATAAAERDQTQSALSGLLAAQAHILLEEEYDLALLLGVESVRRVDTIEGRGSLYTALNYSPNLSHFLHGHQNDIRSMAFHPDSTLLASGDMDGKIFLWDAELRLPLGEPLGEHQGPVNSLSFSPNGSLLASASFDHKIILWDMDQNSPSFGQPVGSPLSAHTGNVWSVAFSPDGRSLASAGADGEIILWDVAEGSDSFAQMIANLSNGHEGIVTSVAFSPDGTILASGGADKAVILWDVETGQPFAPTLIGHSDFVTSVAFSPDGRTLASGSKDNTILLWDVKQGSTSFGQPLGEPLTGHSDNVWGLAFSPEEEKLASGSEDSTLILWDVDTASETFGQPLHPPLLGHAGPVYALAFSPDGESLASGSADNKVLVWDIELQNLLIREMQTPTDIYFTLAFSPDGRSLAFSSHSGTIYVRDLSDSSSLDEDSFEMRLIGHSNLVVGLDFSPDGKILASGSDDYTIILWDMDRASSSYGQPIGLPLKGHTNYVRGVNFMSDGKTLVSGGKDGTILIWDVETAEVVGSLLKDDRWGISAVSLSSDGKTLGSGGFNGRIQFWDIDRDSATFGQQVGSPLESHSGVVHEVIFSPDGKVMASSGQDGTVRLWDVEDGSASYAQQLGTPLLEHSTDVRALAFTPDGKYLVSGDQSGRIMLWEVGTRQAIEVSYYGESESPSDVADLSFSPDGHTLAALFREGRVNLFDFSFESLQSHACQRANRNLTQEEWQRFFGDEPYRPTCPDLPVEPIE